MKRLFLTVSWLLLLSPLTLQAAEPVIETREVQVAVSDAYVPQGFTTSSNVYVVVTGVFPNGCYRWKGAQITHHDQFVHEIESVADVTQGACIMVLVPFTREVQIGQLAAGQHKLIFTNSDGTYLEKMLEVAP